MSTSLQPEYDHVLSTTVVRNRVLRNTYLLLALSMIPTVLGAFLGVAFQLPVPTGFLGFIVLLAAMFGFMYVIKRNQNSGLGVVLLLAFTFLMGILLTPQLTRTLGYSNGASLIMLAFGGTASVFAVLASIASVSKRDFSVMGKWLFAGVIVLILASLANFFLQLSALQITISVLAIGIFSAYILYDVQQIVNGGETNYISATLNLYIDVFIIFQHLLSLLGIGGSDD